MLMQIVTGRGLRQRCNGLERLASQRHGKEQGMLDPRPPESIYEDDAPSDATPNPDRALSEKSANRAGRGPSAGQNSLRKQSNRFELFLQLSRDARSTRGTNSIRGSKIVNEDRLTKSREYSNRLTMIIFYVYNMGGERRVFVYRNALTIILIFVTLHYITLKNKGKIKIKFRALIPRRSHDDPTVPHGGV